MRAVDVVDGDEDDVDEVRLELVATWSSTSCKSFCDRPKLHILVCHWEVTSTFLAARSLCQIYNTIGVM